MKRSLRSRVLSVLMALVMVFSLIPTAAFAAESSSVTWTKVELADIAETDTVMITMTNPSGVTYALDAASTQKTPLRLSLWTAPLSPLLIPLPTVGPSRPPTAAITS